MQASVKIVFEELFADEKDKVEQERCLDEIEAILKKYCGNNYYIKVD